MPKTKYSNYRGRTPAGKILLIVVLTLVILAAAAVILLQQYIVYDESGTPHLLLPEKEPTAEVTPPPEQGEPPIDLTIEGSPAPAQIAAQLLSADPAAWRAERTAAVGCNAFVVDVKTAGGLVQFASVTPGAALAPTAAAGSAALKELLAGEDYAVARLSCFRDGRYSAANLDSAGLKNTGGYLFYDGQSATWLDPGKPAARAYLIALAKECAALGFDELLLTDLSYPTVGKLDKIAYGETMKDQNLALFLQEMQAALADFEVKLSLELPAVVLIDGRDSVAGLLLADLVPLADRIYAPAATKEEAAAFAAAVTALRPAADFVPETPKPLGETYLLT